MKGISKILLAVLFFSSPLCAKEVEKLAAKVNNQPITMSEYQNAKSTLLEQYAMAMPSVLKMPGAVKKIEDEALDKLIEETLLKQKAESLKIKIYERELESGIAEIKKRFATSESGAQVSQKEIENAFTAELKKNGMTMEEFRDNIRKELMVRKLVQDEIRPKIKIPTDEEVRQYFNNVTSYLKTGKFADSVSDEEANNLKLISEKFKQLSAERLRLRHILVTVAPSASQKEQDEAKKKINEAAAQINAGMDFDTAVEKYSKDVESLSRYGDIGNVIKGMLPQDIEKVAFALKVGEVSKPVLSENGWHILRLEEKRAQQTIHYADVKEDLERLISSSNFSKEYQAYIDGLKQNAKVQKLLETSEK